MSADNFIEPVYYEDLKNLWVKAHRNSNICKLDMYEKAFYRVCMIYCRFAGKIKSLEVLKILTPIIEKLKSTPKREALKTGFEKVRKLLTNHTILKLFPKLLNWIMDKNYILYIGFMEINNPPYMKVNITI
ncbi:MAG: hypothetical protein QW743_03430 [Candidatus Methanomethylicia archaeon]